MYSHVLAAYQKALLVFWAKTSKTMSAIAESFKGYQYYEFTVIKDLAEPSRLLAERHSSSFTEKTKDADEISKATATKDDETLIDFDVPSNERKTDENSDLNDPVNALIDISDAQLDDQLLELEKLTTIDQNVPMSSNSKTTPTNSNSGENLVDLLNSAAEHEKLFSEILSSFPTSNNDLLGLNLDETNSSQNNFLPSSLLNELLTSMNNSTPLPPPPSQSAPQKVKKNEKSDWLNLFAELDPIQNPDAIGKIQSDEADRNC